MKFLLILVFLSTAGQVPQGHVFAETATREDCEKLAALLNEKQQMPGGGTRHAVCIRAK